MRHPLITVAPAALALFFVAGCDLLNRDRDDDGTPTSPTPSVSLDAFAGTWNSSGATVPATGCGNLKYSVAPVNSTSANVSFTATCASNIQVTGAGTGKLQGSTLEWTAHGVVNQGGVNCPFTLNNGTATEDAAGTIKVTYSGTVCGIPISGAETLQK